MSPLHCRHDGRAVLALLLSVTCIGIAQAAPAYMAADRYLMRPDVKAPSEISRSARAKGLTPSHEPARHGDFYEFKAFDAQGAPVHVLADALYGDVLTVTPLTKPATKLKPAHKHKLARLDSNPPIKIVRPTAPEPQPAAPERPKAPFLPAETVDRPVTSLPPPVVNETAPRLIQVPLPANRPRASAPAPLIESKIEIAPPARQSNPLIIKVPLPQPRLIAAPPPLSAVLADPSPPKPPSLPSRTVLSVPPPVMEGPSIRLSPTWRETNSTTTSETPSAAPAPANNLGTNAK